MTPTTLTLIAVDGTVTTHTPKGRTWTLEELQALVGGYIETFQVAPGIVGVFDEDGKPKQLPENPVATAACAFTVVGPCLIGPATIVGGKLGGLDVAQAAADIVTEAAARVKNARAQFLFDLFVTALEGGIGYWSTASKYHHSKPPVTPDADREEDLEGFYAVVTEDDSGEDEDKEHRIDRALIEKGIAGLKDALGDDSERYKRIMAAVALNDAGELDAEDADIIVQVGLFADVVYG